MNPVQAGNPCQAVQAGHRIWGSGIRVQGLGFKVNPRKLEHGFRMIGARIPYTLP